MNRVVVVLISMLISLVGSSPSIRTASVASDSKVAYYKASIPQRIFNCVSNLSLTRCMKLLVLARLEARAPHFRNTGNMTSDFLNQVVSSSDDTDIPYNFYEVYAAANDSEINERLLKVFQRFFEGRKIQLHFIPGIIVNLVPSTNNMLEFSLKENLNQGRGDGGGLGGGGGGLLGNKNKKGGYGYYAQFAVPFFVLPAVLFSSFLPFLIPALKMATMFAGVVNNAALLASIMYLARQVAIENEQKQTVYFNPGYNR